jgi:hypothetical protein
VIVLDTNVVSELMKLAPDHRVEAWLAHEPAPGLFITAITEAELRLGVEVLPSGRRRDKIAAAVAAMLTQDFSERVLPFDSSAAASYAHVAADRRRAGRPIAQSDAQIAAIAKSQGATLATRNTRDFEGCGVTLVNPWTT